jgi:hypothetical protein
MAQVSLTHSGVMAGLVPGMTAERLAQAHRERL